MYYTIILSDRAKDDIAKLKRSDPAAFKKVSRLLLELIEHPYTGTGQIEKMKYFEQETYSRRINKKHRVVYRLYDDTLEVLILSSYGHYDDK